MKPSSRVTGFDAARVTLRVPRWAGLSIDASYWFSKAIDSGAGYANTTAWDDRGVARSISMYNYTDEVKSVSGFHRLHALLARINYETPVSTAQSRWVRTALSSWEFGAVALMKSGTPFTVQSGSDSPGWATWTAWEG